MAVNFNTFSKFLFLFHGLECDTATAIMLGYRPDCRKQVNTSWVRGRTNSLVRRICETNAIPA